MESEKQQIEYLSDDSSSEEEPYKLCDHEYTIKSKGYITCLSCGLEDKYLSQIPEEGHESRVYFKNTGSDHIAEIKEKMREIMSILSNGTHYLIFLTKALYAQFLKKITNQQHIDSHMSSLDTISNHTYYENITSQQHADLHTYTSHTISYHTYHKKIEDHQSTDLHDIFYEWFDELCQICNEYKLPEDHPRKKVKRGSPIHCRTKSLCATVLWEKMKSEFPDETLADFAKRVNVTKPTINNTRKKMRQIDLN